jgi:hypothetical protein
MSTKHRLRKPKLASEAQTKKNNICGFWLLGEPQDVVIIKTDKEGAALI